ncbi:hypothetical protein OCU04_004986 [Sclerotinia nivalis]|uniref:SMP-30/Gluconolactonase/LRE-like region domain-containing protein n=1 Tax=Sclerotinia nivalis TaxID=352851 RepID=A0A9X0AN90_9HELO|nr:hypothetical protein OCU04_004986 [Sclerotinia nivalis]
MPRLTARKFRLSLPDWHRHPIFNSTSPTSCICWSLDDKTMYISVSEHSFIITRKFDVDEGTIVGPVWKKFFVFENKMEFAIAFVIDTEDHMWCAVFNGRKAIRISPEGKIVGVVYLPFFHEPVDLEAIGNELVILTTTVWRNHGINRIRIPDDLTYDGNLFLSMLVALVNQSIFTSWWILNQNPAKIEHNLDQEFLCWIITLFSVWT